VSTGIGDTLREAREAQGRSLEDAAQAVRARTSQLQDLEDERFDAFGGEVYAKGFLRSYATELGLDPEPLVDVYRREVGQEVTSPSSNMVVPVKTGGAPRSTTPPAWAAWALVAVVVVAGIVFLGIIGSPAPDTAGDDPPVGTPPASAPSTEDEDNGSESDGDPAEGDAAEPEPDPEPEPEPEPAPEPEFDGVEVVLALEADSWLRVTQDGAVILEEVVDAGETRQYVADSEVIVRFGNAGGVRVQYNGEDIGSAGGSGEVVELRFTTDGFEPT
jgi:cytoskeleton protein RodZ